MELRLSKFIKALEKITDIHNQDYSNPGVLNIPHPARIEGDETQTGLSALNFRMAVSRVEPANIGLPINGIWICMQQNSLYYRQALKLKDSKSPSESDVSGRILDGNYSLTWVVVKHYSDLFSEAQHGGQGPEGPQGRKGIVYRGAYAAETRYTRGSGVMHLGSYWVSNIDGNTSVPSGSEASWQILARVGDTPEVDWELINTRINEALGTPSTPTPANQSN